MIFEKMNSIASLRETIGIYPVSPLIAYVLVHEGAPQDLSSRRVFRLSFKTGMLEPVSFLSTEAIQDVDVRGNLYVCDSSTSSLKKLDSFGVTHWSLPWQNNRIVRVQSDESLISWTLSDENIYWHGQDGQVVRKTSTSRNQLYNIAPTETNSLICCHTAFSQVIEVDATTGDDIRIADSGLDDWAGDEENARISYPSAAYLAEEGYVVVINQEGGSAEITLLSRDFELFDRERLLPVRQYTSEYKMVPLRNSSVIFVYDWIECTLSTYRVGLPNWKSVELARNSH